MINRDELLYKIDAVIDYLKKHNGYNYKLYNHLCPNDGIKPDSNIVEYAEDVEEMIKGLIKKIEELEIEKLEITIRKLEETEKEI